ncbi:MAG: hypothetical protein JST86_09710 [Bacteroidetes bacterium]|nr:hypothetical protein [Bacteroidota bacterium]
MAAKSRKIILNTLLGIVVCAGVTGYFLWNKKHFSVAGSTPVVVITAAELHQSFSKDSLYAKTQFVGDESNQKVIQVNGEVSSVKKDVAGTTIILLKTATDGAFINCSMEGKAENINTGTKIVVKGICTGYNFDAEMGIPGDVLMTRCYIIQ